MDELTRTFLRDDYNKVFIKAHCEADGDPQFAFESLSESSQVLLLFDADELEYFRSECKLKHNKILRLESYDGRF